jgi:hypothetical protein
VPTPAKTNSVLLANACTGAAIACISTKVAMDVASQIKVADDFVLLVRSTIFVTHYARSVAVAFPWGDRADGVRVHALVAANLVPC